jgi:membrane-bound inhibitor of C-type lysozyme
MHRNHSTRNTTDRLFHRIAIAMLAAALPALAGCSLWGGDKGPSVRTVDYQCPGGEKFTVTFTGDTSARLMIAGEEDRPLKRTPAASGARYGDGTLSVLTKGNDALIEERGRIKWRDCRAK